MFLQHAKKLGVLLGTFAAINTIAILPSYAVPSYALDVPTGTGTGTSNSASTSTSTSTSTSPDTGYLQQIAQNTSNALSAINNIPTYISSLKLGEFLLAWMHQDDTDATAQLQASFASLDGMFTNSLVTQATLQQNINNALFTDPSTSKPIPASSIFNPANLTYSTLLTPSSDQTAQFNYILNASGINLAHTVPNAGWGGNIKNYMGYYNTVMAAESFNGYVLSNQYADGNQLNNLQHDLLKQVGDSKQWAGVVATEYIGIVLRQILLFESQIFVLMTQLVQTQKQMVTAQAMTNALIIAVNQSNEASMLQNAKGTVPVV